MAIRSPKTSENKIDRVTNAWESLAAGKSFAGITLEQFKTAVAPSQAARQLIDSLNNQLLQAITDRDIADEVSLSKAQMVINAVVGDVTEGPDSALYEAMGYTRKSDRRSGLTRKSHRAPTPSA